MNSSLPQSGGEGNHPKDGGGAPSVDTASAEAGMAHMSEVFRETGSELYMGAGGREHD
jgi:phosphomethylpyrimidine synthase